MSSDPKNPASSSSKAAAPEQKAESGAAVPKLAAGKALWGASSETKPSKYPPGTHQYTPGGKRDGIYQFIRHVYVGLEPPNKRESAWAVCLKCDGKAKGIFKHSGNTSNSKKHLEKHHPGWDKSSDGKEAAEEETAESVQLS